MSWQENENKLYRKFRFKDFLSAMAFMQKAAPEIEKLNHHPEWKNVYNTVEVWLCTHDAGNAITPRDHKLAEVLDETYGQFQVES